MYSRGTLTGVAGTLFAVYSRGTLTVVGSVLYVCRTLWRCTNSAVYLHLMCARTYAYIGNVLLRDPKSCCTCLVTSVETHPHTQHTSLYYCNVELSHLLSHITFLHTFTALLILNLLG